MSHSTQNRSFRRHSSQPIPWLSTEKRKQTQQKQTRIHNKNILQHKINTKTKTRFASSYNLWHGNRTGLFWKE